MTISFERNVPPSANLHNADGYLGITSFGNAAQPASGMVLHLPIEPLTDNAVELRMGNGISRGLVTPEATIRRQDDYALVRVLVNDDGNLSDSSYAAYASLFKVIRDYELGNLARIWNYIPRFLEINESISQPHDRERYRQFNIGRAKAWNQNGPKNNHGHAIRPAATGMATLDGPLVVEALVTPHTVAHIQNPRQIDPHNYPPQYGSRSPFFARATLVRHPSKPQIYISGTASIVGDKTCHPGDVVAQVEEVKQNLLALLSEANLRRHDVRSGLDKITSARIYIKRIQDYTLAQLAFSQYINCPTMYLRSDICRPDLLAEIEGIADVEPYV